MLIKGKFKKKHKRVPSIFLLARHCERSAAISMTKKKAKKKPHQLLRESEA